VILAGAPRTGADPRRRALSRSGPASTRFCAEAGGVGVLSADDAEKTAGLRSILGVSLDPGEVVILVCRRSLWAGAVAGVVVAVLVGLAIWALGRSMGQPGLAGAAGSVAIAVASGFVLLDHLRRMYVLTDRRVIRRDRRIGRVLTAEAPLAAVTGVDLLQGDLQSRVGVGTVVFRTERGLLAWASVGDAEHVHEIAVHTVKRYGGSTRGV